MTIAWADTNVLLRFLRGGSSDQGRRAQRLMERVASGELQLRVPMVVVAEIVWVLAGLLLREDAAATARELRSFLSTRGLLIEDREVALKALDLVAERRVDFTDAYLAVAAIATGEPVCSFDEDFRRLGVERIVP